MYVIEDPRLGNQQAGQARIIEALFDYYSAELASGNTRVIPGPYREEAHEAVERGDGAITRLVSDLISGLTEETAIDLHHTITGIALGSYFFVRPA